ncbi:MAG TPA: sulfatase [Chitinophagaceae bacterium]|nr:sulfatase [Chitinophagaceae bacterium]
MLLGSQRLLLCLCILWCSVIHTSAQTTSTRPNVLVILVDDLGWMDLGCYGSSFYETPNIDRLAAKGVKFTQAYAASPVCSPTRASLMTGKNPIHTGVTDWIKGRQENGNAKPFEKYITPPTSYQLALTETTIAEIARQQGYTTFFAGKWHLGEEEKYWPLQHGFQYNVGGWKSGGPYGKINDTTGGYFSPYKNPTLSDGPAGEYITDRLATECIQFLEHQTADTPFFMMYAMYAVHNPMQAPTALVQKYKAKQGQFSFTAAQRFSKDAAWMQHQPDWKLRLVQDNAVYAAMIENMDWNIGRMLQTLEAKDMLDNTIVVFTSDNGGLSTAEGSPTSNAPLRAGKGWVYEGGIRVPLVVYWKQRTHSTITDIPVGTTDIFATLAKAIDNAAYQHPQLEGKTIFQLMAQPKEAFERAMYWYYPHYSNQGGKPAVVIRKGDYKLIWWYETETVELYDLKKDIGEQYNLALKEAKVTRQLKKQLLRWMKNNGAAKMQLNPKYTSQ